MRQFKIIVVLGSNLFVLHINFVYDSLVVLYTNDTYLFFCGKL